MRVLMGILQHPNGTYYVRKKVPERLVKAAGCSWLKRSLGTKDAKQANILSKPILIEFDHILARAEASLKAVPVRDSLSQQEIDRIAAYHYASELAEDDDLRQLGTGSEALFQSVSKQLRDAGVEYFTNFDDGTPPPAYGLSEREMVKVEETIGPAFASAQHALARGDVSVISEEMDELLALFELNLDKTGLAYRKLGLAVLKKHVEALQARTRRHAGEAVETPHLPKPVSGAIGCSDAGVPTLRAAFEGWKKAKARSESTLREFEHAIHLFEEFHGTVPIAAISRGHVRQFREALQAVPKHRAGKLHKLSLPELVEWSKRHPEAQRVAPATVNKLLAGPMAISAWAYDNGLIPEDKPWANPFAKMLLDVTEAEREPWEPAELQTLFTSAVFTTSSRPKAGGGEATYWLPLLGIFTGARLAELASLAVKDVVTDEVTGIIYFKITEDESRGRKLKTASSRRVVPVHPELVRLGFFSKVVEHRRSAEGDQAALFPQVVRGPRGHYGEAWSKWFGRYIRGIGIENRARVFHSFRHGFKDALRAAGVSEDINDALTGHAGAGGVGRRYGAKDMLRRFGAKRLAEAVAQAEYPGLDLSHLR